MLLRQRTSPGVRKTLLGQIRVEAGEVARFHGERTWRAANFGGQRDDLRVGAVKTAKRQPHIET
jgi:hypothetical protein